MAERLTLRHGDDEYRVEVLDERTVRLESGEAIAFPRRAVAVAAGDVRWVFLGGDTYRFRIERGARRRAGGHHAMVGAPMPATVIHINVKQGDRVKRGDTLLVVEAMKMELPVRAVSDGLVRAVNCRPGELVQPGVRLIDLED